MLRDPLNNCRLCDRVGNGVDDDEIRAAFARFDLVGRTTANRALATFVDRSQFGLRIENLTTGWEVRTLNVFEQICCCEIAIVDEGNCGLGDFAKVVRRNVCRHADRDSRRTVDEKVWQTSGQHGWLFGCAIVVGAHIAHLLAQLG